MVADFKTKRKKAGVLGLIALSAAILIAFVFMIVADIRVYKKKQNLISQVSALQNKIQEIKMRNENLQKGIANIDDSEYIEKIAREELGLQKKGESVVAFVMPEAQAIKEQENLDNSFSAKLLLNWLNDKWKWLTRQK